MIARTRTWRAALVVLGAACVGAPLAWAQGGVPQYPVPGGESFASGSDGWTAKPDSGCTVMGVPGAPLCSITNERVDDHDGSLQTTFTTLVDVLGGAEGTGGFASPPFSVPAGASIGPATLSLDRRITSDAPLVDSGAAARLAVDLVDVTDPQAQTRARQADIGLGTADTAWASERVALGAGTLEAGHTYRLETVAQLTSEQVQALQGSVAVGFDNVGLRTEEPPAAGPPGATGAAGQAGATGTGGAQGLVGAVVVAPSRIRPRINSAAARRLLRVDRLERARTRGPYANQLRVRVFCKRAVAARCEGTLKIRTVGRINTALRGGRRLRKVTLGTGSYQLPRGRVGYAKVMLTRLARRLLLARGPFRVYALVTVLDQNGRQQVLRRTFRASIR